MPPYAQVQTQLQATPQTWLITGVAGFIGSHLLETLLQLDQRVTGLDNFATGHRHNLDQVHARVSPDQWSRFTFIEGDIRQPTDCQRACNGADPVLQQPVHINGDGETSRDFCYIANAVQANLLAATSPDPEAINQVYNVAVGERTSPNQLFTLLLDNLAPHGIIVLNGQP